MAYNMSSAATGRTPLSDERVTHRLRPKPSSNALRSISISSSTPGHPISAAATLPQQTSAFSRSSIPRSASAGSEMDTSIFTRRDRRPSALPKPMTPVERTLTPVTRLRHSPEASSSRGINALGDKGDRRGGTGGSRKLVREKSSNMSVDKAYTLASMKSGSTTSLSTNNSSQLVAGGSRNASQTSILGSIQMPATSSGHPGVLLNMNTGRKRSGSSASNVPRLMTQDIPPSSTTGACDSSPSTRYTDSPFSYSSTPTSASSHSPGPAAMLRALSSSPRGPVSRPRKGSIASIDTTLDTVRESTTSASSDSTIKAGERGKSDASENQQARASSPENPRTVQRPPGAASAPATPHTSSKSPKIPQQKSDVARKPSISGIPTRGADASGLGVSIPAGAAKTLTRSRSRSVSASATIQRPRRDTPAPPPPSPKLQPSALPASKERPPIATYNTIPPPSRVSSRRPSASRERSTSPSKRSTTPKLAIFSRQLHRAKPEEKSEKPVDKSARKGPIAGTGYEGYGSFGKASRGRSGSTSGTSRSRSGSATSTVSRAGNGSRPSSRTSGVDLDADDYFLDRLKPVVIVGGGVVENHNHPSGSPGSPEMTRIGSDRGSLTPGRSGSSLSVFRREPSPVSLERETVAIRRAVGRSTTPLPAPINTSHKPAPSPSPVSSIASSARKQSFDTQDKAARAPTPSSAAHSKSKIRWNPFQRSHKQSSPTPDPPPSAPPTITRSTSRSLTHYALLDQEEQREADEVAQRLRDQRQHSSETQTWPKKKIPSTLRKRRSVHLSDPSAASSGALHERVRQEKAREGKKLPKPQLKTEVSQVPANALSAPPATETVANVLQHEATVSSSEAPEFQVPWGSFGLTPTNAASGLERSKEFFEYDPLDIRGRRADAVATAGLRMQTPVVRADEWPIRNDSISLPQRNQPEPEPEVEEEWPEYDDLAASWLPCPEEAKAPEVPDAPEPQPSQPTAKDRGTMQSTTSSIGAPFQYEALCSAFTEEPDPMEIDEEPETSNQNDPKSNKPASDSPTIRPIASKDILETPTLQLSLPSSSVGPSELLPHTPGAQRVLTPATPFSLNSFIRGYSEAESRVMSVLEPLSTTLGSSAMAATPLRQHRPTDSTGSADSNSSSGTVSSQLAVDEMKVRPWALLASRWLSFDRVLVSPAHQSMQTEGGRVLVIDGLGTDDWSFYCALSYPLAKIYNLTQTPPPPSGSAMPLTPSVPRPSNHQQVHHPNLTCAFPFPKGFFNVISLRFLPSSTHRQWSFVLSECKRVLQPGGHLEATVLDADLFKTGPRAERAVELVKGIMERENDLSGAAARRPLKPASEKVLKIVEKKGFENVSKCFVGLPAVGKISGGSSSGSGDVRLEQSAREPSPDDPDAINEVVSKVGRWWYTRCYERVITGHGEAPYRSMWNDKGLLRECAKRHTNFKMLVCHARKPARASQRMSNS